MQANHPIESTSNQQWQMMIRGDFHQRGSREGQTGELLQQGASATKVDLILCTCYIAAASNQPTNQPTTTPIRMSFFHSSGGALDDWVRPVWARSGSTRGSSSVVWLLRTQFALAWRRSVSSKGVGPKNPASSFCVLLSLRSGTDAGLVADLRSQVGVKVVRSDSPLALGWVLCWVMCSRRRVTFCSVCRAGKV